MDIKVIRSRGKTMRLTLGENGEAVVRAPRFVTEAEIRAFVLRHQRWLEHRRQEQQQTRIAFQTGEKVTLFGEEYELKEGSPAVRDGLIYLPAEHRERTFVRLLKQLAQAKMGALTEQIARRYGFTYRSVRISSARSRWGSCNKHGVIAYTFRTAFLREELFTYIAVHELCHTRVFNHSPAFWKEVGSILPDWKKIRKELRRQSGIMNLLWGND